MVVSEKSDDVCGWYETKKGVKQLMAKASAWSFDGQGVREEGKYTFIAKK